MMRVYYALYMSCVLAIIVSPGPPSILRFLADLISCSTSTFTIIIMLLFLHRRNQGASQTCVKTFYTMILLSWFYMLQKELIISLMVNVFPNFTEVMRTFLLGIEDNSAGIVLTILINKFPIISSKD